MNGERLSIMHVIARLNVGGAALHVLQLAREQERRGHDVLVVAGTLHEGEESMEYVAFVQRAGDHEHVVDAPLLLARELEHVQGGSAHV